MNEEFTWKKIETYLAVIVAIGGAQKLLQKGQEKKPEMKLADIADKVQQAQEPCLELLVQSLNELIVPMPMDTLREKLFKIIQKQYDDSFKAMVTGCEQSVDHENAVALVKARDELSNQYIRDMLNRVEVYNGEYQLRRLK